METTKKKKISAIEQFLLIIKNWKNYKYWKERKKGKKFRDIDRGAGYYINTDPTNSFYSGKSPIGQLWETKMGSGKIGIYELIDYENYRDPSDMIKHSWWNFIGYKDCKPIHECRFEEYISLYVKRIEVA